MVKVRIWLLGQFVNRLTFAYKYSRYNWENLWQQVPMQISRKLKTFSGLFIAFLKSPLNLEYFQRKDQSHRLSIIEIINCETGSYLNVQKAIFHAMFRQTTCQRAQKTTEIRTKPVSYQSSINSGKEE